MVKESLKKFEVSLEQYSNKMDNNYLIEQVVIMVFIIRTANRDTIYVFPRDEIKEKEVRGDDIENILQYDFG